MARTKSNNESNEMVDKRDIIGGNISEQMEKQISEKKLIFDKSLQDFDVKMKTYRDELLRFRNELINDLDESREKISQKVAERIAGSEDLTVKELKDHVFKVDVRYQIRFIEDVKGERLGEGTLYMQDDSFLCFTDLHNMKENIVHKNRIAGANAIKVNL